MPIGRSGIYGVLILGVSVCGCDKGPTHAARSAFAPQEITLREDGDLKALVDDRLTFVDAAGTEWVAPHGTLTDGASVPRLLLPVTDGRWAPEFLKAAVVHDAYCQTFNESRTPDQYHKRTWKAVHRMFFEACLAGGVQPLLAKIMFAGVWLGGPRWDDPDNELGTVSSDALTLAYIGAKQWIEQNDPPMEQIVLDLNVREPLMVRLSRLDASVNAALRRNDAETAARLLRDEESTLDRAREQASDDLMLAGFAGFMHKNRAELYRLSGNQSRAEAELDASANAFRAVLATEPEVPTILNGMANIAVQRGDLDQGELYLRDALKISPHYEAAKKDLQRIETLRMQDRTH
jgi:Protein of unknown function (DUF1353)